MTFWPNPSLNLLKRLCIKGKQIGRDLLNPSLFPPVISRRDDGSDNGTEKGLKREGLREGWISRNHFKQRTSDQIGRDGH
jgi:hypothetical protein